VRRNTCSSWFFFFWLLLKLNTREGAREILFSKPKQAVRECGGTEQKIEVFLIRKECTEQENTRGGARETSLPMLCILSKTSSARAVPAQKKKTRFFFFFKNF
jgi:hypothetical protein